MKKSFINVVAASVILAGITPFVSEGKAHAEQNESTESNEALTNFKQEGNTIYSSYVENGKTYNVVEVFTSDTSVDTKIYEGEVSKNKLVDNFSTYVENEKLIQKDAKGNILSESDLKAVQSDLNLQESTEKNSNEMQRAAKSSKWKKYGSYNGTNTAKKLTIGSIAATVAAIVKLPGAAQAVIAVANVLYQGNSKKVYYHATDYKKGNPMRPDFKTVYTFYKDKAHKKKIRSITRYNYARS